MRKFFVAMAALLLLGLVLAAPPPVVATGSMQTQNAILDETITVTISASRTVTWEVVRVTAPHGTVTNIRDVILPGGTMGPMILINGDIDTTTWADLPTAMTLDDFENGTGLTDRRYLPTAATARSAPINLLRRAGGSLGTAAGTNFFYSDMIAGTGPRRGIGRPLRA